MVAFTVAATICFASSISITIPLFVFLLLFVFKHKILCRSSTLYLSLLIIFIEGTKFLQFDNQDFKLYVNYSMIILVVAFVISFQFKKNIFDIALILKYYIAFFIFLSLDILILTIKNYGSFSAILDTSFRIGQTDFIEGELSSAMSINANGIGLLAIIAVIVAYILLRNHYVSKTYAYSVMVYSSIIGFLTVSKTFFVIYILMVILITIENTITYSKNPTKILALFVIIVIVFLIFKNTTFYSNIMLRFSTGDLTTGRIDITQKYIEFMSAHPQYQAFGLGLQNVNTKVGLANVPHNAILEIYVTLGIVGLISYLFFFIGIFFQANRNNLKVHNRKIPFLNIIPIIIYLVFIQSLQFLRISYIYGSIVIIALILLLCEKNKN